MTEAQKHIDREEYLQAIEELRKDSWTHETLNMMGFSHEKLQQYENAYLYYLMAKNNKDATRVLLSHPKTELETEYEKFINPKCRILTVRGLRGVFAMDYISMGEKILEIPLFLCENGTQDELVEYAKTDTIYSRSLPRTRFPVEWDDTKKDQLNVSSMRLILERRINQLDQKDLHIPALVGSRNFTNGDTEYLIPFADMLNHSNSPNVEWKFTKTHFVMEASYDIKPHQECLDCYGKKSNYECFLHYSFILPNNMELDKVRVISKLPNNVYQTRIDPKYFQQEFEFELMGCYMEGTVEIFSFLRYIRSSEKLCPQTIKQYIHYPIDKENELWVCKMLFNWLQVEVQRRVKLSAFGIEEPLAVLLLQTEMKVLVHWGETLTDAIKILETGNKKMAKKSKVDYIVKVIRKLV